MLLYKQNFSGKFIEWYRSAELQKQPRPLVVDGFSKTVKDRTPEGIEKAFRENVENNPYDQSINIKLSGSTADIPQDYEFLFSHKLPNVDNGKSITPITQMSILPRTRDVRIDGAVIRQINIRTDVTSLTLNKCMVGDLRLNPHGPNLSINVENCHIGKIHLVSESSNDFRVRNSFIHFVDCPPPDAENPFRGTVAFVDVTMPTSKKKSDLYEGPQQFRNLRHHLETQQNYFEAAKMRAFELNAELELDSGLNWFANWFQKVTSNYGLSPARPLLLAVAAYSMTVVFVFITNGAETGLADQSAYVGWRAALNEPGLPGELSRAFMLPFQSLLNPFGILGPRSLLVASTGWGQVITGIQGVTCDLLIAMSALAIRKRFKLH